MSEYEFGNDAGVRWELEQDREKGTEDIVVTVPTYLLKKARKQFSIKLVDEKAGLYEVPKSESFVYETKELKSGHRIVLQVYRKVDEAARAAEYNRATEVGLKVKPLSKGDDDISVLANGADRSNRKRL